MMEMLTRRSRISLINLQDKLQKLISLKEEKTGLGWGDGSNGETFYSYSNNEKDNTSVTYKVVELKKEGVDNFHRVEFEFSKTDVIIEVFAPDAPWTLYYSFEIEDGDYGNYSTSVEGNYQYVKYWVEHAVKGDWVPEQLFY